MKTEVLEEPLDLLRGIVNNNMCIGCGVCVAQKNVDTELKMIWDSNGFLVPDLDVVEIMPINSLKVCPFNPFPEPEVRTEDELANIFLADSPKRNLKIGRYYNSYVGYAADFRLTSSSGGLASYIISKLLENGVVDTVLAVVAGNEGDDYYKYDLIGQKQDALKSSKTRYYPVTMAEVLNQLDQLDGKVAIVGIPCFIKAIRLHQYYNPEIRERVAFTIGIICGGMKSRFFAEYLAGKVGVNSREFSKPEFRIKDLSSTASDYSFGCTDKEGSNHLLKMRTVGDMWGTGFFKNNACDFCDDVSGELADISLGDAWINPYNKEGAGNNVIITRSQVAENLINEGLLSQNLIIENLEEDRFISSQQGGYNHRHRGMGYRTSRARKAGVLIPPKRFEKEKIPIEFKLVQSMRAKVRQRTLELWKNNKDAGRFDDDIKPLLNHLYRFTSWYHRITQVRTLINRKR